MGTNKKFRGGLFDIKSYQAFQKIDKIIRLLEFIIILFVMKLITLSATAHSIGKLN